VRGVQEKEGENLYRDLSNNEERREIIDGVHGEKHEARARRKKERKTEKSAKASQEIAEKKANRRGTKLDHNHVTDSSYPPHRATRRVKTKGRTKRGGFFIQILTGGFRDEGRCGAKWGVGRNSYII